MKPIFNDVVCPKDFDKIPVSVRLGSVIKTTNQSEWESLFNFMRLNLQDRVRGNETVTDINKLQGKIEFIGELKTFFKDISKPEKK